MGKRYVTSVLSGDYGIYPVSAIIYQRKEMLEKENRENEYRSKIEIQKENIEKCISSGLHFSTVTGDAWYFTSDLIEFLNGNNKDWVFQVKGNRRIKIRVIVRPLIPYSLVTKMLKHSPYPVTRTLYEA